MLKQEAKAKWRFNLKSIRFSQGAGVRAQLLSGITFRQHSNTHFNRIGSLRCLEFRTTGLFS
jgi:hypothetical protein